MPRTYYVPENVCLSLCLVKDQNINNNIMKMKTDRTNEIFSLLDDVCNDDDARSSIQKLEASYSHVCSCT